MRDIVGGIIEGKTVTNNLSALKMAVSSGLNIRWLDKKHMQLMASFDLGANWEKMAKGVVIFRIDEKGQLYPPTELGE